MNDITNPYYQKRINIFVIEIHIYSKLVNSVFYILQKIQSSLIFVSESIVYYNLYL